MAAAALAPSPGQSLASGPARMCAVCRHHHPQAQLQRWVMVDGRLTPDASRRQPGRGWYSCSADCAAKLQQRGASRKPRRPSPIKTT